MTRRAKIALIGAGLVLLITVGLATHWLRQGDSQVVVTWGGPSLSVSEREYLRAGMESLLHAWEPLKSKRRFWTGPAKDLVFDLENQLLWLTAQDASSKLDYVELPAGLSWKLYACSRNDVVELPPLVCLKPARAWRGTLVLLGYGSDGAQISCALHGRYLNDSMKWAEGEFDPNTLARSGRSDRLSSILITDPERLQQIARTRPIPVARETVLPPDAEELHPLARRRAIWQRLQKPLYQALEQESLRRGNKVMRISVQPGPDYTAGLAGLRMQARPAGRARRFWSFLRARRLSTDPCCFVTVDALGDGRWHCLSTQRPKGGGPRRTQIEFDFYVEQPDKEPELSLPRKEPQMGSSPWTLTLAGGTRVELIGVCAHSGSHWWAPDGSMLDNWPGFYGSEGRNRIISEITSGPGRRRRMRPMSWTPHEDGVVVVLRVPSSVGFGDGANHSTSRLSSPSSPVFTSVYTGFRAPLFDRFGLVHSSGQYIVLNFSAKNRDSVSHALGVRVGNVQAKAEVFIEKRVRTDARGPTVSATGPSQASQAQPSPGNVPDSQADSDPSLQWIHFKNLSLRPGLKTKFQMFVAEDAGNQASRSKVQVRP
jgi:hypothetical protein